MCGWSKLTYCSKQMDDSSPSCEDACQVLSVCLVNSIILSYCLFTEKDMRKETSQIPSFPVVIGSRDFVEFHSFANIIPHFWTTKLRNDEQLTCISMYTSLDRSPSSHDCFHMPHIYLWIHGLLSSPNGPTGCKTFRLWMEQTWLHAWRYGVHQNGLWL